MDVVIFNNSNDITSLFANEMGQIETRPAGDASILLHERDRVRM
jgi:hypothetical protein